jgi:mono/diheme cytochrome c family protein
MTAKFTAAAACLAVLLLGACDQEKMMSERGFRLPDGDPQAGRDTFIYMQCVQCHTVKDIDLPAIPGHEPYVELGGSSTQITTYGELVTAIVNPSHKLAEGYPVEKVSEDGVSNMYIYNEYMTVQELTDLVRFLQPHYKVVTPDYSYRRYR